MGGVLFACMVAKTERLGALEAWYDRDHLPGRMAVPGFLRATRYRERSGARVRATACLYELASAMTLSSPAYLALQERTAQDTADHLAGLPEMWRIAGEPSDDAAGAEPAQPSPLLLACLVVGAEGLGMVPGASRTRRVATTAGTRSATLVLSDLAGPPDEPALPRLPEGSRVWLLERLFTRGGH